MGVYLSLALRAAVNLESLNMAESVGNVTKHRKAPVVVVDRDSGEYRLLYVPVISGMSLAHHYQHLLAKIAHQRGINVTRMSLMGYFIKFADQKTTEKFYPELGVHKLIKKNATPQDMCRLEEEIVKGCVVADVGGFLQTETGVKRTSRFSFSYMMPAMDALSSGAAAVMPQLHVRYTPTAEKRQQALIYVEGGSAVYTLSYLLEASEVSRLTMCEALGVKQPPALLSEEERRRRVEAALDALAAMLDNMLFGAKRSRSLPHWEVLSAVAAVSSGPAPFVVSNGHSRDYLASTATRAEKIRAMLGDGFSYSLVYYDREGLEKPGHAEGVTPAASVAGLIEEAKRRILQQL